MNLKLNKLHDHHFKDDAFRDFEEISKDLKRPYRGNKTIEVLAYVVGALTIASILV
ncbi:MAG: hypothetical protein PWP15_1648 [Methanothermococcus sp.]|jgi:hypothetical protein|uniref:hypothetical protein n=1 Tax=Methanothermococcus TaxID=155862 RepID=UPI0003790084|nr:MULTISPECIES: hypothetical protein [Methanothermococcus]MDK2791128.1 hypothetical protein [Methanothermococcus sp.]MDK2987920.1 hypothetical protein [Methanothermococcus sp.]